MGRHTTRAAAHAVDLHNFSNEKIPSIEILIKENRIPTLLKITFQIITAECLFFSFLLSKVKTIERDENGLIGRWFSVKVEAVGYRTKAGDDKSLGRGVKQQPSPHHALQRLPPLPTSPLMTSSSQESPTSPPLSLPHHALQPPQPLPRPLLSNRHTLPPPLPTYH